MRFLRFAPLLLVALTLSSCVERTATFMSTDISGADFGKDFHLTDHNGKARTLADFRGSVVAMFFGYTQCPDVCPTSMTAMADVLKRLEADARRVQVLFVTVDPERDTPAMLAQYVPQFHPSFLGLYGDVPATRQVAKDFKVFYEKRPGQTPTSYTIDHTAGIYVFDPQGRLRLLVKHGEAPDRVAADIRLLLSGK